ncbi:MAG: hypothetical protein Q8908_04985 [Bacteroidota bacterium]|nr:hypothetical protein [Bacteroidota bacterium]
MKSILFIFGIVLLGFNTQTRAQADLMINPNRVVFDDSKQREEISLVNMGKDTATFSITFVQRKMKEDGSFEALAKPEPGQMLAEPYVRVYPRHVTLAPGEPQLIVLQYRRQAGMAPGEYRSHLYFRAEPTEKPVEGIQGESKPDLLIINLNPIYGITIPVIIRIGQGIAGATLSDIKLNNQESAPTLQFTINRSGNLSTYGDLTVEYNTTFGRTYRVGYVKGVGVYTNLNKRQIAIKLNAPSGNPLKNGTLKIRYANVEDSRRPVVYTEGTLDIK